MEKFKVKKVHHISEFREGQELPTSDYVINNGEKLIQFEFIQEEEKRVHEVKPGVFAISKGASGFELDPTSFVRDKLLEEFLVTSSIKERVDRFFNKLHIYKEEGIVVPRRNMLLYGPPGCGKSTALSLIAEEYRKLGNTAIVCWPTDKFEASDIKDFIRTFKYVGVERLILYVEDIGGSENKGQKQRADASLLSLLDNQESILTIPTMIIATTNYPENLMESLVNRPQRFDDKMEISYPAPDQRAALLKFFVREGVTDKDVELIRSAKCKEFSVAHIREVRLRSRLNDQTIEEVVNAMASEIEYFKAEFAKKNKLGFN